MKKIFSTILVSAFVFFAISVNAQTKETGGMNSKTTTTKEKSPSTGHGQTTTTTASTLDQSKMQPSELAVKVTDWMKTNVGDITDAQAGRINVATTNLLTKVRDIRSNVTDAETRKYQIHLAMQTFNGQITSVLSAEQATVYKAKKKQLVSDFKEMKDETETISE